MLDSQLQAVAPSPTDATSAAPASPDTTGRQPLLFEDAPAQDAVSSPSAEVPESEKNADFAKPAPRINRPERCQGEMYTESLDQRLDLDHPARMVWAYVEGLNLSELFARVKAVEGQAGRNATDFRVLFALLLWAAIDGVASAREIDRLSKNHRAYEWLRGGVPVNYHMIADFRVRHEELLDRLLTESLASLSHEGLIQMDTTAQDGMKVRAAAGSDSFRREGTLKEHLEKAEKRVQELREQANDPQVTPRQKAARERAAREKRDRLQAALEQHKELAADREKRKKGDGPKTRTSSTDPEARKMQMPDRGYRPAYNVQFNTTTETKIIVGADVINQGNDAGQMQPMIEQTQERLDQVPANHLVDGGFSSNEDLVETTKMGTTVYAPVKKAEKMEASGENPYEPKKKDKPEVASWRQRMGTAAAKALYKLRGETAEWVNAGMRNRGMYQFLVRGLAKVKAVVLWHVLAHNLLRAAALRAEKRASAGIDSAQ